MFKMLLKYNTVNKNYKYNTIRLQTILIKMDKSTQLSN